MGARKNGRAGGRHARGEGAPARKTPKNVSCPRPYYLPAVARSVKTFDRKRLTSHKQSVPPEREVHFIFSLKYICYKDQLGYLIIERRSNKLMVLKHTALNRF